jgi:predicted nuclease with TOPRIM domain
MLQTHQEGQLACQALANQYHDAKHCVEQREKQLSRLTAEFKDLRRQAERAEERYQSLLQEKNEMKRRLELKHSEVGAASEDLQLMTRENQSLTSLSISRLLSDSPLCIR